MAGLRQALSGGNAPLPALCALLNIAKQRSGPLRTVKLAWLSEITTFANLAREDGSAPRGDAPF